MNIRAELHCYHCGYVAARIEGESDDRKAQSIQHPKITPSAAGPGVKRYPGRPPRCGRCNGPLFIDEVEVVRYPPTVIVPLPPGRRRGRPPKILVANAS